MVSARGNLMTNSSESYRDFVMGVTSKASKEPSSYLDRLAELSTQVNIAQLDTALTGINSEAGEALDLLKKVKFQGKPWNEETRDKLIKEAGDVLFYLVHLCVALGITLEEAMALNQAKLEGRYAGGVFSVAASENRTPGK